MERDEQIAMGMNVAVIVATLGRRAEAQDLVADLLAQTRRPDRVVFCVVDPDDAPDCTGADGFEVLHCDRKGSCAQRNIGIDHVAAGTDLLVFFDDDFIPAPDYLEHLVARFEADADLVGATGLVVADGVTGPGLSRQDALAAIAAHRTAFPGGDMAEDPRLGLYGCNMAVRMDVLGAARFDETLPLYGWLEDLDLTAPLRNRGRLVRCRRLVGAHRGVKRGRTSGVRFGYSQIANPVYLLRKGTVPRRYMVENMTRNFAANTLRALRPEPYVDRRGRLKGNLIGLADLLRGRSSPTRILDF